MSARSASFPKRAKGPVDRAFAPEILEQAREIAGRYQVILRFEDGEWYGRGVELPDAHEDGRTPDECVRRVREMFVTVVAYLLEEGRTPPAPADEEKRTVQVNVRFTPTEKVLLESAAARAGRGVSDYLREKALSGSH